MRIGRIRFTQFNFSRSYRINLSTRDPFIILYKYAKEFWGLYRRRTFQLFLLPIPETRLFFTVSEHYLSFVTISSDFHQILLKFSNRSETIHFLIERSKKMID